jgi:toxin YoeB
VSWTVLFTKQAQKDARKLASASPALKQKAQALLEILAIDPYQQPPPYEALVGDLRGACSRRINIQHRLVYQVLDEMRIVKVLRLWSHDESFRPATGGMASSPSEHEIQLRIHLACGCGAGRL